MNKPSFESKAGIDIGFGDIPANLENKERIRNILRTYEDLEKNQNIQTKEYTYSFIASVLGETFGAMEKIRAAQNDRRLEDFYIGIVKEMRQQHQYTRQLVENQTTQLRHDLISCIKQSPSQSLELFSKWGLISATFCLLVQFVSGFIVVNPLFAIFMIFCSMAGWGMAKINQKQKEPR